jgi:hypothetical protein
MNETGEGHLVRQRRRAAICLACAMLLPAAIGRAVEPPRPRAVLEKDLRIFLDWFAGEFDNHEQVAFADELGVPRDAVPERIHSVFRRVELPAFGEHVFYVEQYLGGDPSRIYRQRLYSFAIDEAEHAIRLDIHVPNDPAPLAGAHREPSRLASLVPADTRSPPGCAVYWHRRADAFVGSMKPGACTIRSERSGKTIVVSDDLYLDDDELWIHDRAVDEEGQRVYGNMAGIPHKLKKVHWFRCWLSVRREDVKDDAPGAWTLDRDIAVHDGGELVWIQTDARKGAVGLKIRRPVWPSGPNQDALVLYVHDRGSADAERAVGYGWADARAARIGINLRWMQAGCNQPP